MKVLQFGFSNKGAHIHLPHRFTPRHVAYTGTHDNNTTLGWWKSASKPKRARRRELYRAGDDKPPSGR